MTTYHVQAAIAAVHAVAPRAEDTDWRRMLTLYDDLQRLNPSPVVALNRAVALARVEGPTAALVEVIRLEQEPALADYYLLPSVKGALLVETGDAARGRAGVPGSVATAVQRTGEAVPDRASRTVRMRALITGAGIGGLTAAIALRRAGLEVEVYERAPRLAEVGAGISLGECPRLLERPRPADEILRSSVAYRDGAGLRTPDGARVGSVSVEHLKRRFPYR